jgi:ParB/RepB/Spo0J family partition protein
MAKIKIGMNKAGTGKIDETAEAGGQKWTKGVKEQINNRSSDKILAKYLPVNYIQCDPENPRQLAITPADIQTIASKFPMDKAALSVDDPNDYLESYIDTVTHESSYTGKALGDLIDLIEFAASLKDASRLLEPIIVRQDDSTFHLIAGERRLLAHVLLAELYIASIIRNAEMSRADIDIFQWEENVSRKDMSMCEKVMRVDKIVTNAGGVDKVTVTKVGKILGKSRAEAQRYLSVLRYPDALLMTAINEGRVTDLKKAAELAQLDKESLQQFLFHKVVAKPKPSIKIAKTVSTGALRRLVEAAATTLKKKKTLKDYDLSNREGVMHALEELLKDLEVEDSP